MIISNGKAKFQEVLNLQKYSRTIAKSLRFIYCYENKPYNKYNGSFSFSYQIDVEDQNKINDIEYNEEISKKEIKKIKKGFWEKIFRF